MKNKNSKLILNIILACLFVGILIALTICFAPHIIKLVSDPQKFRAYLLSFGPWCAVVFMFFQVLQVVIAIIPGEPVQIAGGYIFGTVLGAIYSTIGITAGYIIVFVAVRLFGLPLVKKLVSEKDFNKFNILINSSRLEATIFLLFLIPGIPKDILVYIAGLTPINGFTFFVIITIARLPAMVGSSYIGAKMQTNEYAIVIIVSVIAVVLFMTGFLLKDRIIGFLHKFFAAKGTESSRK